MGLFTNKETVMEELSLKLDKLIDVLASQNQNRQETNLEKKDEDVLDEEVTTVEDAANVEPVNEEVIEIIEETVIEMPESTTVVMEQPSLSNSINDDVLNALLAKLSKLEQRIDEGNYKDSIIKDLHKELQDYKRDIFADFTRPLLNNILKIYKNFNDVLIYFDKSVQDGKALSSESLAKSLKQNLVLIKDMLEDEYDLEYFEPRKGEVYMPKEHHALEVVETNEESEGGLICTCKVGGFRNVNTGKIFKLALVSVYKYVGVN